MKIAIFLDEVNQAIDNSMQWSVMSQIGLELGKKQEVIILDPLKIGIEAALNEINKKEYDILLTYNKTGVNLVDSSSNKNLMSVLDVPQISWLVEHPITFFDQYKETNSPNRNYIFSNPQHQFFSKQMGLEGNSTSILFGSSVKKINIDYNKREFDLCIAAQWRGPADINMFWKDENDKYRDFFEDVNTLQNLEDNGDVYTAFVAAAEHHKISLNNKINFAPALKALYWHARKSERIKMVQDLVKSGLKILLIGGEEWKSVLLNYSNVTFVPPCAHNKLIEYYKQSRAVASTNCFNGANERTFDALSCGAISISENSPTLVNHFKNFENIIFYDRLSADRMNSSIVEVIKGDAGAGIANAGLDEFVKSHTWAHRVAELNEYLGKIGNKKYVEKYKYIDDSKDIENKSLNDQFSPILYQSYVGDFQKSKLANFCKPLDASYNNQNFTREYNLFKDIILNNKDLNNPWGLISWKFSFKTLVDEASFFNFSKNKLAEGYDCTFINPMIGNEALFPNVWVQGQIVHPGMDVIAKHIQSSIDLDLNGFYGFEEFSFCNYFMGNDKFWKEYISFVDHIMLDLSKAADKNKMIYKILIGSAKYSKDNSITMQPFIIERLFSSFLKTRKDIRCARYPVTVDNFTDKFGKNLGSILFNCFQLKLNAIKDPKGGNLNEWIEYRNKIVKEKLLGVIFQLDDPNNFIISNGGFKSEVQHLPNP